MEIKMPKNQTITAEYAASILDYDKEDGIFTWRERPKYHFADERSWKSWNSRHAGKQAGSSRGNKFDYINITLNGMTLSAHRIVFLLELGHWPDKQVDHINGICSDNRRSNLRLCSQMENMHNRMPKTNTKTGMKGVCYRKADGKYVAKIRRKFLGSFDTPEEAAALYEKMASEVYGEYSLTNSRIF
jgi:hypothetical protein